MAVHTDTLTQKRARRLRRDLTDAERILWSRLKGRRLGAQFRVQHPIAPYIADFACVSMKLIVEVDGATHSTPAEQAHDEHRRNVLERSGWTILRVWNDDVYRNLDGVIAKIVDTLLVQRARVSPPPSR
jgi:very-short-patch-repair endonuclease